MSILHSIAAFVMALIALVTGSTTTMPLGAVATSTAQERRVEQVPAAKEVAAISVTYPKAGDVLQEGAPVTVRWTVPRSILDSIPDDFNTFIFLYANRENDGQGVPNSVGIGDGNPANDGAAGWNMVRNNYEGGGGVVPLDPGRYKITARLAVEPKDHSRLCKIHEGKDCVPDAAAQSVMARASTHEFETGWFTIKGGTPSSSMKTFTDTDFGFTFSYPDGWQVVPHDVPVNTHAMMGDALPKKSYTVEKNGSFEMSVAVYVSDTSAISDDGGAGPLGTVTYYFDKNSHQWMTKCEENCNDYSSQARPAGVTYNTMGGLHMFSGTTRFDTTIIPLTAHNFVVTSDGGGYNARDLARTVVATDPSVATPWSALDQREAVKMEARSFGIEKDVPFEIPGRVVLSVGQTGMMTYDDKESYETMTLVGATAALADLTMVHREITCVLCHLDIYRAEEETIHVPFGKEIWYRDQGFTFLGFADGQTLITTRYVPYNERAHVQ